jgi:archaemetzincin
LKGFRFLWHADTADAFGNADFRRFFLTLLKFSPTKAKIGDFLLSVVGENFLIFFYFWEVVKKLYKMKKLLIIFFLLLLSCQPKTKEENYFKAIEANDINLESPKEGEWLYEHKEKGQTFEQYQKARPIRPDVEKNIIYLKPIGQFSNLQKQALKLTRAYLEIFFQQKTVLIQPISDRIIPISKRRIKDSEQLLAPYILDSILVDKMPKNGLAMMAITEKDLFPKPDWNYVFGLASYHKRVGVSSIYRLQNKVLDKDNFSFCLNRLISVSSHEIGHMMSMHHCIYAQCVMNGSNNLDETDSQPNRLCSQCQRKLSWNFGYDNEKRLRQLHNFFTKNHLKKSASLTNSDLSLL